MAHKGGSLVVIKRTTTIGKALLFFFPSKHIVLGLNLIKRRRGSIQATFFFLFPCLKLIEKT